MQAAPSPVRPRRGCLTRLLLMLLLGAVAVLAIDAVFAPWSFFMGGKFHVFPMWQGWGGMHSSTGDYVLLINMQPRPGKNGIAHVTGHGVLCTPRGQTFNLRLSGEFEKHMGANTDKKKAYFYLHKGAGFFFSAPSDSRPELEFYGFWRNPDLVLDDHGSLLRAFTPDGSLYEDRNRPAAHETINLTLHEGSWAEFNAACAAVKKQ